MAPLAFVTALPLSAASFAPRATSIRPRFATTPLHAARPSTRSRVARQAPQPRRTQWSMELSDVAENSLTVLVVGSGGREHALVSAIAGSPYLKKLIAAPGNIGMPSSCELVPDVGAEDVDAIVELAVSRAASLVVVGPEVPLVNGLADKLTAAGIPTFGPAAAAAQLEGSKVYSKWFLLRHEIPTANFAAFADVDPAKLYVRDMGAPIVVKAAGLAAGKGVILAKTVEEGLAAVDDMLVDRKFGEAGAEVVIEEMLKGEEVSFFAVCDGETAIPLASAQDHKAAYDGDKGPNTGGMGAYSPAPVCDAKLYKRIMDEVVTPTLKGLQSDKTPFRGVIYFGLMVDEESGALNVLEYNVRFGDPECQVLCERLRSDMLELLYRGATGRLGEQGYAVEWDDRAAVVVVMATDGYPGEYEKGSVIGGLDKAGELPDVSVYHAGTAQGADGQVVANGGRVLGVTAVGQGIEEAQRAAYQGVDAIEWKEGFCRRDIGWRGIAREAAQKAGAPAS